MNLTQYEGQYEFWHNPMVMTVKICANNILYWGTECLLFFHDKYADVEFMALGAAGPRADLGDHPPARGDVPRVERARGPRVAAGDRADAGVPRDVPAPRRHGRRASTTTACRARLAATADLMEAFAVLAFSRAAQNLGDAAPGEDEKINPYAVSLDPVPLGGRRPARRRRACRWPRRARPTRPGWRTCSWRRWRSPSRRLALAQATSGRVSAFTNSSSWSVRQHSNAVQCCS